MNFNISQNAFPALLLLSNDLLARVAIHGFEQGLLSAVVEWFARRHTMQRTIETSTARRHNEVSNDVR
jgi:hypothetical protein